MAIKPVTRPYYLKDATFKVEADDYAAHCSEVRLTPSQQSMTWKGIAGNVIKDQSVAEWSCVTAIVQDGGEAGLHRYFLDNVGQTKQVEFVPYGGGDPVYVTIIIAAPEIGGSADSIATASVTHAVLGQPTYTLPSAAPTLTSATPSGAAAGDLVTIKGSGFTGVTGAGGVKFASANAAAYTVLSDTTIVASLPAGSAGSAAITITHPTRGASTPLPYTRA